MSKIIVACYGAPGSRKTTFGEIAERIANAHLFDMGRHLKQSAKNGDPFCIDVMHQLSKGVLVSDNGICAYMRENKHLFLSCLVKHKISMCVGFPRTASQCVDFMQVIRKNVPEACVIGVHVNTPRNVCVESVFGRAQIEERDDDADQKAVDKRFSEYDENSPFVVPFLSQYSDEFFEIDGTEMKRDAPKFLSEIGLELVPA